MPENQQGTLELLSEELTRLISPLTDEFSEDGIRNLFEELGVSFPSELMNQSSFVNAIGTTVMAAADLPDLIVRLKTAIENEDWGELTLVVQDVIGIVKQVIESFDDIASGLDSSTVPGFTAAEITAFAGQLAKRLSEFLIINHLEGYYPIFLRILTFIGAVKLIEDQGDLANLNTTPHLRRELVLENFGRLFSEPDVLWEELYGWDTVGFTGNELMNELFRFLISLSVPVSFKEANGPTPASLNFLFAVLQPRLDVSPKGLELKPTLDIFDGLIFELPFIIDGWKLKVEFNANLEQDTALLIQPGGIFTLIPPSGEVRGDFKIGIGRTPLLDEEGVILFGESGSSRLQVKEINAGIKAGFGWNTTTNQAEGELGFEMEMKEGEIIIDLGNGDGFLASVFPEEGLRFDFGFSMGYLSRTGFYFTGSAGLDIALPVHLNLLDIINLDTVFLVLGINEQGISTEVSVMAGLNLGPLTASVERLGVQGNLKFQNGNLGPLDLTLGFKPPNGVGLSVDAGVVKGGGYLYFDYDREEYAGALELIFSEWIAIKAVGLITTRLPDGSKGFSMVIIISVEFGSGLQLGFGFTLLGVGGILGINRTVNIDAMSAGVRSGAIESVMFPENVVANAPKIISDLRQFFPALNDQFLIGPMAKIGYGTPTLISLSLGVIIEFPDVNITILGILKVALPTEEASIIKLQVNFLGRIEPSNNLLWFHAFLFDSRILFITLEGGMGLLVNWGDDSNFVVSVGGFHPRFNPPPLPFPEIPRIAVNILNESMARIRIEGYFAVTSNTVQFGARAELFFGFSAINVQGHLGFDALFQFNPFYFIFEFSLGLSVKVFGFGLFSIDVSGLLEGPAKWHIEGTAKWKITWFGPTIRININETWGEEKQTELPPIEAFPLLEREFTAITNWEAVVPKQSSLLVALRKLGDAESEPDSEDMDTRPLVLHPVGTLRISQRKIPLKLRLDKIGSQQPSDVNEFTVTANLGGGGSLALGNVREKFARGEFQELDKATKLSTPAFEKYESGLTVSADGDALQTSMAVKRVIRYETIIIDNLFKRKAIAFFKQLQLLFSTVFATLFSHFLKGNTVTRSVLSFKQQKQLQPNKEVIAIRANEYSVAFNDTNKPIDTQSAQFKSQAEATDYLRRQQGLSAKAAQSMHVIPNTEVNTAA